MGAHTFGARRDGPDEHRPRARYSHRTPSSGRGRIARIVETLGTTVPKQVRPPRFYRVLITSGTVVGLLLSAYSSTQVYLHFSDPDAATEGGLEQLPPEATTDNPDGADVSPEHAASDGSAAEAEVSYESTPRSGGEFGGELTIHNTGSQAIQGWDVELAFDAAEVTAVWGAAWEPRSDGAQITPADEQGIAPGESLTIHFEAEGADSVPTCLLSGSSCGL